MPGGSLFYKFTFSLNSLGSKTTRLRKCLSVPSTRKEYYCDLFFILQKKKTRKSSSKRRMTKNFFPQKNMPILTDFQIKRKETKLEEKKTERKRSTRRRIFLAGEDKEKSEKSSLTSSSSFRFILKDK